MYRRTSGFSLIELMTVLAVIAILAGMAGPALARTVERFRARAAVSQLANDIASARMTAVARNEAVTLCPSADFRRCTDRPDWSSGWIVFLDGSRSRQPAPRDMLATHEAIGHGIRLSASTGRTYIRLQPGGWASGTNLSIRSCTDDRGIARLVMNNAARVRIDARPFRCLPA